MSTIDSLTTAASVPAPVTPGIHIPAMQGRQGDRPMYLLLVTNRVLLRNFSAEAEVADTSGRVQRSMDKRHMDDIAKYIVENTQDYILGAMTYAIDTLDETAFIPSTPGSSTGILVLPMDAELRCLDGQHRRHALHEAAAEDSRVLDDFSAIVLYVEDDYTKRRQMFSDMNATPKVVAKSLNITFDTRDPYARAAQRLADDNPLLRDVVEREKARISASDPKVFSLSGIYDALKRFDLGMILPRGRSPKEKSDEELFQIGMDLFDLIAAARPEFQDARDALKAAGSEAEKKEVMKKFRRESLLASTTTLRVIAGALHEAMDHDGQEQVQVYKDKLKGIDFTPASELFNRVDFVGRGGTPVARNQEVVAATKALAEALHLIDS